MKPFRAWWLANWRLTASVLAAVAFVSLSGVQSWSDFARGMQRVNQEDQLYRFVAQELDEPSLCDEIPWSAESPGGFFIAPSYERSNCYAFIAGRTKNPLLCWQVRRLGAFRLLSQQTSMWSCMVDARRGLHAGIGVNPEDLVRFFTRLGYDPDTLHLEGVTPPVVNVKDFYRQLPSQPDIVMRIERAIGASGSLARNDSNAAYLADIAALVTEAPGWCARIPEDLRLVGQRAGFRDWCLFTLATNTKNPQLCNLITNHDARIDPRMSRKAECERLTHSPYPVGRYGPEVPETDERTRAVMAMLHYEIPRANTLPQGEVYAAYERFLHDLNQTTDSRHAAARQRFIARVRALRARRS